MQRMMKKTMKKDLLGRRRRWPVGKGRRRPLIDMVYYAIFIIMLTQLITK